MSARPGHVMPSGSYSRPIPADTLFQQNQLQFNLNVASHPENIAARFRHPGPLVIEKLGGKRPSLNDSVTKKEAVPSVKFSVVSEDRLSVAIQMAKRDLKNKMREDQQRLELEAIEAAQAKALKGKKKVKKSQALKGKTKKFNHGGKVIANRQLPVQERAEKRPPVRTVQTQTPPKQQQPNQHRLQHHQQRHSSTSQHGLILHLTPSPSGNYVNGGRRRRKEDMTPVSSKESRVAESPMSQQAREIKRLRQELKQYIGKIEQLSRQTSENITKGSGSKSRAESDMTEEEIKRQAARKAEQASRSARLLYSLQQQVREIQEELDKLGPGQIRHTKKSRAMNKLAAAHRGAVRALQAFVNHLPDHQSGARTGSMPPLYQELAGLIRQLSLCCAQLEIGDSGGVPDGVLNIIEQAKGLEIALEQQLKSPPKTTRSVDHQSPSPRRRLAFGHPAPSTGQHTKDVSHGRQTHAQSAQSRVTFTDRRLFGNSPSKDLPVRDTDLYLPTPTHPGVHREGLPTATPGSPERNAIMRAGLQALLRAQGNDIPQHPIRNPVTNSQPIRNLVTNSQPIRNPVAKGNGKRPDSQPIRMQNRKAPSNRRTTGNRPPPSGKSVILPAKLKADRERIQRSREASQVKDAHFTLATKSSIAKQHPIKPTTNITNAVQDGPSEGPLQAPKPAWTPPGTPRSFHRASTPRDDNESDEQEENEEAVETIRHHHGQISSPRSPGHRSSPRLPGHRSSPRSTGHKSKVVQFKDAGAAQSGGVGLDAELSEKEIARQVWLDKEVTRRLNEVEELRKAEIAQLQKLREDLTLPSYWIDQAERAVKVRVQPLIDKAQELSTGHRTTTHQASQGTVGHELSKRALNKASEQGDLLSDLILDDILEDTAQAMQRMEHRADIEQQAISMQNAPTIEGLLQTLDVMEAEEDRIRRRWKKVSYADSAPDTNTIQDAPQMHRSAMEVADGGRDDWMSGTPLEGALLERLSSNIPQQHTSMMFTNVKSVTSSRAHPVTDSDSVYDTKDTHTRWAAPRMRTNHYATGHSVNETHHSKNFSKGERHFHNSDTREGYLQEKDAASNSTTLHRPKYSLFVSTESRKRADQYRERFDRHLKRKFQQSIGTFDPWSLCDELADEILADILDQVTSEVSDTMTSCVDDLYKTEFDVTSSPISYRQ